MVLAEMRAATRYYNGLVTIENWRRLLVSHLVDTAGDAEQVKEIASLVEEYAAAKQRVKAVVAQVKAARIKQRKRTVADDLQQTLIEARSEAAVVRILLNVARRRSRLTLGRDPVDPVAHATQPGVFRCAMRNAKTGVEDPHAMETRKGLQLLKKLSAQEKRDLGKSRKKATAALRAAGLAKATAREEINEAARAEATAARKTCGLYNGTYLRVEAAVQAACSAKESLGVISLEFKDGKALWTGLLRRKPIDGCGHVGPQVQWVGKARGKTAPLVSDLFSGTRLQTLVRIERTTAQTDRDPSVVPGPYSPEVLLATRKLASLPDWATLPAAQRRAIAAWTNAAKNPADPTSRGSQKPRPERVVLHLRVQSDKRKRPVWATLPMLLDRPLPDGIVKWVSASRTMIGPREVWSCEITIDEAPQPSRRAGGGAVVVHLGWHREREQLRVATMLDEHGAIEYVYLADGKRGVESGANKADSIESIRDRTFDTARDGFVDWLRVHGMPVWMRALTVRRGEKTPTQAQAVSNLSRWKSLARLASLALHWRSNRFTGDDGGFLGLEWWRYDDHHLWAWQRSQETRAQRRRRDQYRVFAARLAERYGTVILDDADYRRIAEQDAPGGVKVSGTSCRDDGMGETSGTSKEYTNQRDWVDRQRRLAAPSILRGAVTMAFKRRGAIVEKVEARNESIECPACGEAHPAHQSVVRHDFACSRCAWSCADVDVVACLNAMRRSGRAEQAKRIIARMARTMAAE